MKRSQRLQPVRELATEAERTCAIRVSSVQKRLADATRRHGELARYLLEYQQMFQARAATGMGVSGMRDYQTFIARLTDAVTQQQQLMQQLDHECEQELGRWRRAAARKAAVGTVIARADAEDQRVEDRLTQNEFDERAQRHAGAR